MDEKFDFALQRDSLCEQVADRIQDLIVADSLCAGDKLPGERDLAGQLGVSRTVVREAIRILSVRGLVKVKTGRGTYVQQPGPEHAAAPIELLLKLRRCPDAFKNLYEIRHMLEVEIAGLAAQRATEEDLAALEAAMGGMAAHTHDPEAFIHHDLRFHSALAAATHNELFCVLLSAISDLWSKGGLLAYRAPGAAGRSLRHHRDILKHVREHDPEKARRAMRSHVRQAQGQFEEVRRQVESS